MPLQCQQPGDTPTPAADAFAFGIILWELYHGRRCFVQPAQRDPEVADGPPPLVPDATFPRFPANAPLAYVVLAASCMHAEPAHRCDPL